MKPKLMTDEEKRGKIKQLKKVSLWLIAAGILVFVASILIDNIFPDFDSAISSGITSVSAFLITYGAIEFFKYKKLQKNPDTFGEPIDERAEEIGRRAAHGTFGVYGALLIVGMIVTTILEKCGVLPWLVPAIILGNFLLFMGVFALCHYAVKKRM